MFHVVDNVFFPQPGLMEFVQGKVCSLGGHLVNTLESCFSLCKYSSYLCLPSLTFCQFMHSVGIKPMTLALLAPCSTIWAIGKIVLKLHTKQNNANVQETHNSTKANDKCWCSRWWKQFNVFKKFSHKFQRF